MTNQLNNMSSLLKEIIAMFFIIIFSNTLVDLGSGEKELKIMINPIKTIGITLIISILGGYILNWVNINAGITKSKNK